MERQEEEFDMSRKKHLKPYTKKQIENWGHSSKIEIYKDEQHLMEFVKKAKSEKTSNKKMYFGIIPSDLAERVKKMFQVDIEGHRFWLYSRSHWKSRVDRKWWYVFQ